MDAWIILLLIVLVAAVAFVAWGAARKKRTENLRGRFGPEYSRTVEDAGDRKDAEKELQARADRRAKLDIRPLAPEVRERYADRWREVQTRFVDDPSKAVVEADELVQRAADVSVDHPRVVESYRAAHSVWEANRSGSAGTEDLRQALVHYRALFDELLGAGESAPRVR
jgi:hypothetical protein